jgi:DNA uptake protein ComE-like DNA-binding protein
MSFVPMNDKPLNWKEAFTFTRSERRGFFLLTLLLVLSVAARVVYFRCVSPSKIVFHIPNEWLLTDSLFVDPSNDAQHAASNFINREYGSRGRYMRNTSRFDTVPMGSYSAPFKRSRIIELNTADTLELRGLPSIGPWLARKIVEYRDRLGGFYSSDQLLEIYRLTPGKLDTIAPFLVIDTSMVRRIDINKIQLEELLNHPYLSRSQAKGLLAYRQKHGAFVSISQIRKCLLIDEKTFEKVRDYMEVR